MYHESQVLLLCADPAVQSEMINHLTRSGVMALVTHTPKEAQTILLRHSISVVFCEDLLVGVFNGELPSASNTPLVVISRTGGRDKYLEALIGGAFEFVMLPSLVDEIKSVLRRALRAANTKKSLVRR